MSYNADKNGESMSSDVTAGSEIAEEIRELLALAGQLFQNDQGAEACQLLKRVLEMDPANQLVHRLLGRVNDRIRTLVETGQIEKAATLLVKVETSIGLDEVGGGGVRREIDAHRNRDVRAELLLLEARNRAEAGSLDEARESLRRILEVDPSHTEAAVLLAENNTAIKKRDLATSLQNEQASVPVVEVASPPVASAASPSLNRSETEATDYSRVPVLVADSQQASEYSPKRSWLVFLVIGVVIVGGGAAWMATRGGAGTDKVELESSLAAAEETTIGPAVPNIDRSPSPISEKDSAADAFNDRGDGRLPDSNAVTAAEVSSGEQQKSEEFEIAEERDQVVNLQGADLELLANRDTILIQPRQPEQVAEAVEMPLPDTARLKNDSQVAMERRRAEAAREAFGLDRARLVSVVQQAPERFNQAMNLGRAAETKFEIEDFGGARLAFEAASRSMLEMERQIALDAARAQSDLDKARSSMETARSQAATIGDAGAAAAEVSKAERLRREGKTQEATASFKQAAVLYGNATQRRSQDRSGILATLDRYEVAMESQDINALRQIWPSLQGAMAKKINESFRYTKSLSLTLDYLDFNISGDTASVNCQRQDHMVPEQGQEIIHDTTVTFRLRRAGSIWVIEGISQ